MLRKKGIKGISANGPIIEHPLFGWIQWNQSYSHLPQRHQARAVDEPKLMDMDEAVAVAAEEEAIAKPDAVEEEEECEETITISAADLVTLQDTLDDMQFKIANIKRDARQA